MFSGRERDLGRARGFDVQTLLYGSSRTRVLRAVPIAGGPPVALKMPAATEVGPEHLARYRHEVELLRRFDTPSIVRARDLVIDGAGVMLVLEPLDWGETLATRHQQRPLDRTQAVRVAALTARALGVVHRGDVVHRDLSPSNLFVDEALERVTLIDFDIASAVATEEPTLESARALQGTLPYVSPEQTGRMNRAVDYRSDYYALGAILYELLTGVTPFVTDDAVEMVHAHVARRPVPPHELHPAIPPALSAVVMKLLEKNADLRYQSWSGLERDLTECAGETRPTDAPPFRPGANDPPERFLLPQTSYGRDSHAVHLLECCQRAAAGTSQLVLVSGHAGVGKTFLVRDLNRSITGHRGYSVAGKFDQLHSALPHSGLLQALSSLMRMIATEPAESVNQWRDALTDALAGNGQVLVDVIPELSWVLGPQAPVPPVGLAEGENRFHQTLLRFFRAVATPSHPLVLFLDDLQWADRATLAVLRQLMLGAADDQALLLVGAYRSDEVDEAHPLSMALADLANGGFTWDAVALEPLSQRDTSALVGDAVHHSEGYEGLAALVHRKTSGNPFYVRQFLRSLVGEGLLVRDPQGAQWRWEPDAVASRAVTENVADMLERHMRTLPDATQEVLRLAACVGSEFSLESLCQASALSREQIERELVEVRGQGFVMRVAGERPGDDPVHRFAHDRIRQAAYALLGTDAPAHHLRIGRRLLAAGAHVGDGVFDVVGHLNRALAHIDDAAERQRVAQLNLAAGRRAKRSAAFENAAGFLAEARRCLPADAWTACHRLKYDITKELAECRYLSGAFDEARALFDEALAHASTRLDKAALYAPMMIFATHEGRDADAVAMALESLGLFGMRLRTRPGQAAVMRRLLHVKYLLARRDDASILAAPDMADPERRVCLETLLALMPPSYACGDTELFTLAALTAVTLSLEHGNTPGAGFGFTLYGMLIGAALGQYEAGRRYGELGLALLDRYDDPDMSGRSYGTFGSMVHIWTGGLHDSVAIMRRAFELNVRGGNLIHAGYNLFFELQAHLHVGSPFPLLEDVCRRADAFLRRTHDEKVRVGVVAVREMVAVLSGHQRSEHHLIAAEFGPPDEVFDSGFGTMKSSIAVQRMMIAYLLQDKAEARRAAELSAGLVEAGMGTIFEAAHRLFHALVLCEAYEDASLIQRQRLRLPIGSALRKLRKWARACPETFEHQHALLTGEWARVTGRRDDALRAFERCIGHGAAPDFVHHVAIANERAARVCLDDGRETFARTYLRQARTAYSHWGAVRKVEQLEAQYADWLEMPAEPVGAAESPFPITTQTLGASLDLATVLKASQSLSAEVDLERLLTKLMTIAIESAGAQRAFLVQDVDGELRILAAVIDSEPAEVDVLPGLTVAQSRELSQSIVRYVMRTGESLVLHDAATEERFAQDEYLARCKPKSVLCSVLRHKDRVSGAMYLENRLAAGAFTEGRIELLRMIFAQAAISLENAQLYQRLRVEVAQRVAAQGEQQRLLDILEATPDFVGMSARDGRTLYVNRAGRAMVGLGLDEDLSARTIADYHAPNEARRLLAEVIPAATRHGSWAGETALRHADGTEIPTLQVLIAHKSDGGDVAYYSTVARDITEYRDMSERLRQTTKMEAIGQLAGGVAHDFNNLLGGIVGYAELLRRALTPDQPDRYVAGILNAANRAAALTGQLLAFSRRTRVESVRTDLHEIVANVVGILQHTIDPRIEIRSALAAAHADIDGDPAQLENAVLNLAINARDAMPDGGTLSFETSLVSDDATKAAHGLGAGTYLQLCVTDTGVGMDESVRLHIFEPFFTTKKAGEGTGLGLAATYGTVESHDGAIDVASARGEGTVFTLWFPVAGVQTRDAPAHASAPDGELVGHGKILLADDEAMLRDTAARSLEYLGYQVSLAGDGSEAVRTYRERPGEFDLVILDVHMPTMNGLDALREIRRLDPGAPVLIASGHFSADKRAEILREGDVGFIQKPFNMTDLSQKVAYWIRPPRPSDAVPSK